MTTLAPHLGIGDAVGLTSTEAAARHAAGLNNTTTSRTSRSANDIIRANVITRLNVLLGSLFALMLVFGSIKDAVFGVIVAANIAIGVVQELRAKRTLDRLVVMNVMTADVLRDGQPSTIPSADVVLGDLVRLRAGDQIVADGVVMISDGVELDESLLSGESAPVRLQPGGSVRSGTVVTAGSGWFRTDAVGAYSYAQRLTADARAFAPAVSELQRSINRVLRIVTIALVPIALMLLGTQLLAGQTLGESVTSAVGGTVGMVPDGLVLLTSIAFAVSTIRLGRRNVLVQELPAVEGLARVDIVCFDKTGTLTDGNITVQAITTTATADPGRAHEALAALTNDDLAGGNATGAAIAEAVKDAAPPAVSARVAFSSQRKWSAVTLDDGTWYLGGSDVLLDPDDPELATLTTHGSEAQRLLVLARSDLPPGDELPNDLTLHGVISLRERIRSDAAATIRYLSEQGIQVKVISGDDPRTAAAVATAAGVPDVDQRTIDSRTLPTAGPELAAVVESGVVFGRTTPEQKQQMVKALQANGHVVAMTGDGVNDVLALKAADIGIAMGHGTAAARSAGQIVLLNNDFASVPHVIAEGRRVLGNIERVAGLFLTKTCYVLLIALATGAARLPFPFLPRHLSLISTLTIGVPGFFLAFSPNTNRYRPGLLRRCFTLAAPAGILAATASFSAYAVGLLAQGVDLRHARTSATLALLTVSLWVVVTTARPLTRWKALLIASLVIVGAAVAASPPTRSFYELRFASPAITAAEISILAIALATLEALRRSHRIATILATIQQHAARHLRPLLRLHPRV